MDLFDELHDALSRRCVAAAGLKIGTSSTSDVRQDNTVEFLVDGAMYSASAQEVAFTATDHDIAADASTVQEAVFVVSIDSSGNLSLTMGTIASGSGEADYPEWDDIPSDEAVIGSVRIAVDAGSTKFDATSDALSAGHLTVTYTDLGFLFPRFDVAQ